MARKKTIEDLINEAENSEIDYSLFDGANDKLLEEMNKKHAFINSVGGRPMIMCNIYNPVYEKEIIEFRTPDAIKVQYSNKTIEVMNGARPKYLKLGQWWVENPNRREYETIIFDPNREKEYLNCYNLWDGFNCIPKKGSWKKLRKHIWEILCNKNKEKFRYVLSWFAWCVQNPGSRAEVSIIFKGKQGAGKGLVMTQFVEIFGRYGTQISNREHLTGKFTGHLKLIVFLFADEAYYPGDKEVEGTLNMLISEEKITREAKFSDPVLDKNRLHIAMATNNEWIIPAKEDSRRFFVNEVDNKYAKNQCPNEVRKKYFDELWKEAKNGGREAMLYDLLHLNLKNWHPRDNIPQTEELKHQIQISLPRNEKAILTLLEDGILPSETKRLHIREYKIKSTDLHEYIDKINLDLKNLSLKMKCRILESIGAKRSREGSGMWYKLPDLSYMRRKWNKLYTEEKWNTEDEEWAITKEPY